MPLLRIKEIRDMSKKERMEKLDEFKIELLRLKTMIKAGGAVENPARISALRKTIARIMTIDSEPQPEPKKSVPKKKEKKKK